MSLIRELARRAVVQVLGSRPLAARRLRRIAAADPLVILSLHRVAPADGSLFHPLSPAMFEELLRFALKHFALVTFETAGERSAKPRMILSFDDGYRDFAGYAMPILARYGVRVNQNVIAGAVESGLPPLQVLAADFLGQAPPELVRRLRIPGFDTGDPRSLWPRLDRFIAGRAHEEQRRLAHALIPQFQSFDGFRPTPMMSRDEVGQAAGEHEIGGHSFDHASMALESDDYLLEDVRRTGTWIEEVTGRKMRVYAFPNGSHRAGQPEAVRRAGIDHVLLAGGGLGGEGGIHDRIGFAAAGRAELRFRALGARAPLP